MPLRLPSNDRGFTLVEALVALTILGIALLLELGVQWQTRAALDGLEIESALLARGEATIESVRAGVLPLTTGRLDPHLAAAAGEPRTGEEWGLEVARTDVAGVCSLTVRGRASERRGRRHSITLETKVWRPGASCD